MTDKKNIKKYICAAIAVIIITAKNLSAQITAGFSVLMICSLLFFNGKFKGKQSNEV